MKGVEKNIFVKDFQYTVWLSVWRLQDITFIPICILYERLKWWIVFTPDFILESWKKCLTFYRYARNSYNFPSVVLLKGTFVTTSKTWRTIQKQKTIDTRLFTGQTILWPDGICHWCRQDKNQSQQGHNNWLTHALATRSNWILHRSNKTWLQMEKLLCVCSLWQGLNSRVQLSCKQNKLKVGV